MCNLPMAPIFNPYGRTKTGSIIKLVAHPIAMPRLPITELPSERASFYIDHFLEQDGEYFKSILEQLGQEDLLRFQSTIKMIIGVIDKIPNNECYSKVNED